MVQLIISPPFALCLQVLCTEVLFMPFHFSWPYAKGCLWAGAPDHFLHIGLLKPTLSFWRIYTPGYYFSNEGPKATCGKRRRRAVARSEQYPGVNNIPKGLTCIHPEVCSTFMVEANIFWTSGVIETPGQLLFVHLFWIKLHWFMGTCFVQYSNAGLSDQTCNMHPWTLPAASAAGVLWPEVNNMQEWTISRRALHVFTLKWIVPEVCSTYVGEASTFRASLME